ncbi:hypothetical protein [Kutzneria albida]|uniref:Minor tail protein n=1 Tax=Kutzneria albida DSM 43870 TaxID=1449976 RepID=W5WGE5_9PSEU|nr:hypothetical protein [Kutzneria albida]AHH97229.1 hypothetical protein KALB_3865 [Kutzneria albida DSM 43870]
MSYTYLIADVRTGAIVDELPLTQVTFDSKLNETGSLRAQLQVTDPQVSVRDPRALTEPGRTALYVDRDGTLVWGGIIWTTRYDVSTGVLEIGASDFLSYLEHRYVLGYPVSKPVPNTPPVAFTGVDQVDIARELVRLTQSHPGGDIGLRVLGPAASGVPRTVSYAPSELKPVADALRDLANAEHGFDFVVDVRYGSDGRPQRTLRIGHPALGQPGAPYVWEFGANLVRFVWPLDGSTMATRVFAQGAAGDSSSVMALAQEDEAIRLGWPLLEATSSQLDTANQDLLDAWAAGSLAAQRRPVALPEITVRADLDPLVGTYSVGDTARVVVDDLFFPHRQLDVTMRILSLEVTPGDQGEEEVKLTVASVEESS